jgi:hypothetical protein
MSGALTTLSVLAGVGVVVAYCVWIGWKLLNRRR